MAQAMKWEGSAASTDNDCWIVNPFSIPLAHESFRASGERILVTGKDRLRSGRAGLGPALRVRRAEPLASRSHSLPKKASEDAMHIAVAAVHAVDFLLTWNCRHIANAHMRDAIDEVCREAGYKPPVICTPEELSHDEFD